MKNRYERLKEQMIEDGLDVVVTLSPENVLYFTEAYIDTQKSIRDRLAIGVFPLVGEPCMIACIIEKATVDAETWIDDKRFYIEFQESPMELLADFLKEKKLDKLRIGIELDYLTAHYNREIEELLPQLQFLPCSDSLGKIRAIKETGEIEKLQHAALQTLASFEAAIAETSVGETERMFGNRIQKHMIDRNCDSIEFLALATGERSILVHGGPEDVPMLDHTHGRIDFGGLFDHYNSDIARTFLIGRPNEKHKSLFENMVLVYKKAIESCQVGVPANTPFMVAKAESAKLNLPFNRVHEGHGLGLVVHEMPILSPGNTALFEEDMVICVEHAIHADGYRYHIEDLVRLTSKGPVVLSHPDGFDPRLYYIDN